MKLSDSQCTRVAYITNIPVPYRNPVFDVLSESSDIDFTVIYCAPIEPNRKWMLSAGRHKRTNLIPKYLTFRGRYIHFNSEILSELKKIRPDVVVTTGFNPSHLMAFLYAWWVGARHVAMTDGTFRSEQELTWLHRLVRRLVYRWSQAFIGPSEGSIALYKSYSVPRECIFKSHLCADNDRFNLPHADFVQPQFDFLFSGRFEAVKNPTFAIDVAAEVARHLGRVVNIAFMGSGSMDKAIIQHASALGDRVTVHFLGFVDQEDLPRHFANARVFLFPTSFEPWGVVANEACAAGLPVITTPVAGVANEIVRDGYNGYVCELNLAAWVGSAVRLLSDPVLYEKFSKRSKEIVQAYNFANAAYGLEAAIKFAMGAPAPGKSGDVLPSQRTKQVVVVQRRMTSYRVPFFETLRYQLADAGYSLTVVYGDPTKAELSKGDSGILSWGVHKKCRYLFGDYLCWQNIRSVAATADLIVLPAENKMLWNIFLQYLDMKSRVALWGHGGNLQGRTDSLRERFKRKIAKQADWWFGYTDTSRTLLSKTAFPLERLTVLNNSVDTLALVEHRASITQVEKQRLLEELQLKGSNVCVYVGSLYQEKRIGFLLDCAHAIHRVVPDFELIVIGAGPDQKMVEAAAEKSPWLKYVGVRQGRDKVLTISLAKLLLNPGLVGLGILDSFAIGVPMVTTEYEHHSPEIAYLKTGINGLVTPNNEESFVSVVCAALNDPNRLNDLRTECLLSAEKYDLESMAKNFVDGVSACFNAPPLRK